MLIYGWLEELYFFLLFNTPPIDTRHSNCQNGLGKRRPQSKNAPGERRLRGCSLSCFEFLLLREKRGWNITTGTAEYAVPVVCYYFFLLQYHSSAPRATPPVMLPKVTGRRFFSRKLLRVRADRSNPISAAS